MSSTQPQAIVGIDFGMTFTGVAYSNLQMPNPHVIRKWPPRLHEAIGKVPSILSYPTGGGGPVFGFPCMHHDNKHEWFKRYLDPSHLEELRNLEPDNDLPDYHDVRKWYRDYMRCLYTYVHELLSQNMGDLNRLRVEWVFSLPTTFRSQEISNTLLGLLREAGFGSGSNHTVKFGLTEPQASAVDAAKYSSKTYEGGDIMLSVDAGGGTTDFALLEQTTSGGARTELREIATIPGIDVGSTNIDSAFETLVDARLRAGGLSLSDNTSWTMRHSEFQTWKCNFGEPSNDSAPAFGIRVPLLNGSISNRAACIHSGSMMFSHADFRQLFDPQIDEIVRVVRQQLDSMIQTHPDKQVNYLILSGGLGSSPYLLKRLRNEFRRGSHQAAPSLDIILSDEPQLAVCRGLVIDRIQRIITSRNVLSGRICPASYGVLCDMPYDGKKHINQSTYKDPINGLLYARNQVVWMIKKGETVDIDKTVGHTFTKIVGKLKDEEIFNSGPSKHIWKNRMVISILDANRLPSNASHADCHILANVTSDLSTVPVSDFEVVKEHKPWFKKLGSREKYRIAEHQVRIVVGSADITFELWYKGQQYNRPNSIRVEWLEGAAVSAPNENRRMDPNILAGVRKRKAMRSQRDKSLAAQDFRNNLRSPRSEGNSRRSGRW